MSIHKGDYLTNFQNQEKLGKGGSGIYLETSLEIPELRGNYIKIFPDQESYKEERENDYYEPWLSYTDVVCKLDYNKTQEERMKEEMLRTPLSFEIVSGGTLYWYTNDNGYAKTIEFKKNNDEWSTVTSSSANSGTTICTVVPGDVIQFRGNNAWYGNSGRYNKFVNSDDCVFYAYGNIMSLISSDNFVNTKTFTAEYALRSIFHTTNVMIRPERPLFLPADILTPYCYIYMFEGCQMLDVAPIILATGPNNSSCRRMFAKCTALKETPELPATNLKRYDSSTSRWLYSGVSCYQEMFSGCTALEHVKGLPATDLASSCYTAMFIGCTSLKQAPELPAVRMTDSCYDSMFRESGLVIAPELPATVLDYYCYRNMFCDCWELEQIPSQLPAMNIHLESYRGMFARCYKLETACELPATGMANSSYYQMFYECTGLKTGPTILPADMIVPASYYQMFKGCTSLTTLPVISATKATGSNACNSMFSGCTSLTGSPTLNFTDFATAEAVCQEMFAGCVSLTGCSLVCTAPSANRNVFYSMFKNCTGITEAYIDLESTNLGNGAYQGTFINCRNLDCQTKPVLSATDFKDGTARYMFSGCTSLTKAPDITVTSLSGEYCMGHMFAGCSSLTGMNFDIQVNNANYRGCFEYMFNGCTALDLPSTFDMSSIVSIGRESCRYMFQNCSNLTVSPNINVSAASSYNSFQGTFKNCTGISAVSITCTAPSVGNYGFNEMFMNCSGIQSAYIDLESTTLGTFAYDSMFANCVNMDCAVKPIVSASSVNQCSMRWMFSSCYSLTKTPDITITAMTSHSGCYRMFYRCSGITSCSITCTAPIIASSGFCDMYQECTNLEDAHIDLETQTFNEVACCRMFRLCGKLNCTIKPVLSGVTYGKNSLKEMFYSCSTLTTPPDLSISAFNGTGQCVSAFCFCTSITSLVITVTAPSVANSAFEFMCYSCTSLTNLSAHFESPTVGERAYYSIFRECRALDSNDIVFSAVTAAKNALDTMFVNCTSLTKSPEFFVTSMGQSTFSYTFAGCSSLTTPPPILPATTLQTSCYQHMFENCVSLTTAPELPATTLVNGCYDSMFIGCSSLNYIKCLATSIGGTNSHRNWVSGVQTISGTFVKAAAMTSWPSGASGIPNNWTVQDAS